MYLLIIGLLVLTGTAFTQDQPAPSATKQAEEQAPAGPPENVGNETCLTCHDIADAFARTPHAKQECESCHGPGSAHSDAGGDMTLSFKSHPPKWVNSRCMACHSGQEEVSTYHKGAHGRNDVSCVACHQAHPERVRFGLLKAEESSLCVTCHPSSKSDFQKPYHHPVLEGGMRCSDCHSPHSEARRPLMKLATGPDQRCVSCHSEKGGPFIFEHAPTKINDCSTCHQPHGSVNGRLLRRAEVHMLCLECHSMTPGVLTAQPPAFHDLRSPRYRNCTVCHREIHGSNASPAFVR